MPSPPGMLGRPPGMPRPPGWRPPERGIRWGLLAVQVAVVSVIVIGLLLWLLSEDDSIVVRDREIARIRQWAQVAPLPKSAKAVTLELPDTSPDRSYSIGFQAAEYEVENWLAASPGLAGVKPEMEGLMMIYRIRGPKDAPTAARGAVVYVLRREGRVRISVPVEAVPPPTADGKQRTPMP